MKKLFTTIMTGLVMTLFCNSTQAQNLERLAKPISQQSKMGVPSSVSVTAPVLTRELSPSQVSSQDHTVTFWVNFQAPSSAGFELGMYELKVNKQQLGYADFKLMGQSHGNFLANQGGVYYDGIFYCCNGEESYGYFDSWIFNYHQTNDWKLYAMYDPNNAGFVGDMVTLNPITKKAYGTYVTTAGEYDFELCEVDYERLERKFIAKAEHRYCAMCFDSHGRWLGINGLGDLYEINTTTGVETYIGSTGLQSSSYDGAGFYFQAGCYDPATDTFFWGRTDLDGKSAIYAVNPQTAEAQLYATLPNYTLINFMMVSESYDTDAAPGAVDNLMASTIGGGTEATISFTMPVKTIAGGSLSGQSDYQILVDGAVQLQKTATAGATINEQLVLTAGAHRIDVVVANNTGIGLLATTSVFVGFDTPDILAIPELVVEKTKAVISWEAAVGEFGGNVGDVTYTITRYPDNQVIATNLTATTFTDETIPSGRLVKYYYGITPQNSAGTGREKRSNGQTGGSAFETPYYFKARTDVEEQDLSFVDSNKDKLTWEVSDYWDFVRFSHKSFLTNSSSLQFSDDWLFLPAITLKAGIRYQLEFDEHGTQGFSTSEKLEIKIGTSMAPDKQIQTIATRYEIPKNEQMHRTFVFTVSADADYYIGFHVAGVEYEPANDIQLRNISVVQSPADNAPAAVEKMQVAPGSQGAYSATVSFTVPSKTMTGGPISQVNSVRIYRNNVLVHTFGSTAASTPLVYTDNTLSAADNGINQYVVVATNDIGDGEIAYSDVFIGVDKPTTEGISGTISEQNGHLLFQWTPVSTVGAKEGYVDPNLVTYHLYETRGARNYALGSVTGQTSFEYEFNYNEGEQRMMQFSLGTSNNAGYLENSVANLGKHLVGEPYRIPFTESVAGGSASRYFFWDTTNSNNPLLTATDDSFDEDGGCFQWSGGAANNYYSVNTGKIRINGASNPQAAFAYKFTQALGSIGVSVMTPDQKVHELQTIQGNASAVNTWQIETVSLDNFLNEDYVILMIQMNSDRPSAIIKLDDVNVIDMPNYNLSVSLNVANELRAGAPADVNIIVRNLGERDMSDYTLTLYEDNREVFSKDVEDELSTLRSKSITASYVPNVFSAGQRVTLRAEVSHNRDRIVDDNQFETEIVILSSEVPQPENLKGEEQAGSLVLTWNAPSNLDAMATEDFEGESFTDFSTGGIYRGGKEGNLGGGWTVYDADNSPSNRIADVNLDESDGRSSWIVFNSQVNANSTVQPHSGEKFIVSFDITGSACYDWLISPQMTGKAQTIRFFATEPAGYDNHAKLQVLASSTDTSVGTGRYPGYDTTTGSFTVIGAYETTGNGWDEFSVQLPEGSKFFAIRNISPAQSGRYLCIDDISYSNGSGEVLRYNIYADGLLVGFVSGTATTYTLIRQTNVRYSVTAVYDGNRESAPVYLDGGSSGISNIEVDAPRDIRIYDLYGRRINQPTRKGIYVINGKKVVKK